MIVAIPLFGREVAPRFCFADEALVAELRDGREAWREAVSIRGMPWPERLGTLAAHRVEVLLCGGFNRKLLPMAEALGIEVVWGLFGEVAALLATVANEAGFETLRSSSPGSPVACRAGMRGGTSRQMVGGGKGRRRAGDKSELEGLRSDADMTEKMMIAVAADDDSGLDSQVSAHFGRCPHYTVVEVEGQAIAGARTVENPNAARHEPGAMPHFIKGLGAQAILSGGMGPRAIEMFGALGIDVATGVTGTVRGAVEAFLGGEQRDASPCEDGGHDHGCGDHDETHGSGAGDGLVLVPVRGPDRGLDTELDPRFGRAERFAVVDLEAGRVVEELDNPSVTAAHGAGSGAASIAAGRGVKFVLAGRFGPNASQALEALGIGWFEVSEGKNLGEALAEFRSKRSA